MASDSDNRKKRVSDDFQSKFEEIGGGRGTTKRRDFLKESVRSGITGIGNYFRQSEISRQYEALLAQKKLKRVRELNHSLIDDLKAQGKLERKIANARRNEMSAGARRLEIKDKKKNSTLENEDESKQDTTEKKRFRRIRTEWKKTRLAVREFSFFAWGSLLERLDVSKRKDINSTLEKLAKVEEEVRGELRKQQQGLLEKSAEVGDDDGGVEIISGTKKDKSDLRILPKIEDSYSKYGSKDFEMPRFSHLTQKDIEDFLNQQAGKDKGPVKSSEIRAEVKEFLEYYNEVSKWRGLERGLRATDSLRVMNHANLGTEVQKLTKEIKDIKRKIRGKETNIEETNIEEYRNDRIKKIRKEIGYKKAEMEKIEEEVKGIREKIGKIREEYRKLAVDGRADLMDKLIEREKSAIANNGEEAKLEVTWVHAQLALTNSTIADNTAYTDGGDIVNDGGDMTASFCAIYGNSAQGSGGGIVTRDATVGHGAKVHARLSMKGNIVAGNKAPVQAGIVGLVTTNGYNLVQDFFSTIFADPYRKHSTDLVGGWFTNLGIDAMAGIRGSIPGLIDCCLVALLLIVFRQMTVM